eukprot:TRINITY_DN227_c0_g1_i9.p1 TRINITY_DN227_c0_g1~~TRINITY_DN227_c0_g1_i9.p1  ORF type:complete len:185 (+),score=41.34 TRINITY_DN227_c0_g1_i9:326-880(+)
MGVGFFSRLPLVGGFFQREYRILVIGLDNSGKTTLLDLIKQRVDPNTNSVGFALEVVFVKKTVLNVWDVSGQEKIRPLWVHYFQNTQAVIYVIDASDEGRVSESKKELLRIMDTKEVEGIPFLLFANKHDVPNALQAGEITKLFELEKIKNNNYTVAQGSAKTGEGVMDAFDKVKEMIDNGNRR